MYYTMILTYFSFKSYNHYACIVGRDEIIRVNGYTAGYVVHYLGILINMQAAVVPVIRAQKGKW